MNRNHELDNLIVAKKIRESIMDYRLDYASNHYYVQGYKDALRHLYTILEDYSEQLNSERIANRNTNKFIYLFVKNPFVMLDVICGWKDIVCKYDKTKKKKECVFEIT